MKKYFIFLLLLIVLSSSASAVYERIWINMTSNTAPSPYVVYNSSASGVYLGYKAFDRVFNSTGGDNYFQPATSSAPFGWVRIDLGAGNATALTQYSIDTYASTSFRPKNWILYGSNDTVTWTKLDDRVNYVFSASGAEDYFNFTNTNAYRYYQWDLNTSSAGAAVIVEEIQLFRTAGGTATLEPSWINPTPTNGARNNTQVTITANCTGNNVYMYFQNETNPSTLVLTNSSDGNYTTNVTIEQTYYYKAMCYNTTSLVFSANTSIRNWSYDLTSPVITINSNNGFNTYNASNENQYDYNLTLNITFADNEQLYAYEINITKDGTVAYNETNSSLTGTTYTLYKTLATTAWSSGVYNIQIFASDSHTAKDIPDYFFTKSDGKLSFSAFKNNVIEIYTNDSSTTNAVKLKDRYTFEFNFSDGLSDKERTFYVSSSQIPLRYLENSAYNAHFVVFSGGKGGNWIDFEGINEIPKVKMLNEYLAMVTFKKLPKDAKFNSIGGLNIAEVNYTWFRGNASYNNIPAISGESSALYFNISFNGTSQKDINATFIYNTTVYTATKTEYSNSKYFNVSFPVPAFNATIPFYWNIAVYQNNGLNYSLNYTGNQTVSSFTLDACTVATNKTITFSIFNETTPSNSLNASVYMVISYWITSKSNSFNFTNIIASTNNFSLCLSPADATFYSDMYILYTVAGGFSHRYYLYNQTLTNTTTYVNLYNFDYQTGVSSLRMTARNEQTYSYFPDVVTSLQRFYVGENLWRTVQMDLSGEFGLLNFNIIEKSVDYRFIFKDQNNNLLKTTNTSSFSCDSSLCELTVLLNPFSTTTTTNKATTSLTFSNTTNILNLTWTQDDGTTTTLNLTVEKQDGLTTTVLCGQEQTGTGGLQQCNLTGYEGEVFVYIQQDGSPIVSGYLKLEDTQLGDFLNAKEKAFWAFCIVLLCAVIGLFSPTGALITTTIGVGVVMVLGIAPFITIATIIILTAITILLGLKIRT